MAIWRVYNLYGHSYYAERIEDGWATDIKHFNSHCLQCAKTEIMAKTGEPADIRGWHRSTCGAFTKAMRISIDQEQ